MLQITDKANQDYLERVINNRIDNAVSPLEARLQILESPVFDKPLFVSPSNYLSNSHCEWSHDAYTIAGITPATAGDGNQYAYNWYIQTAATTALSTSTPLLAPGHSGFGALNADAPVWDRVNGTFLLGSATTLYDVACPLPTDFVLTGQKFYVYFEASLESGADPGTSQQFYCGFWDNTAGQQKWITGGTFAPTVSVYGVPGTRTLKYKVLAETDTGTQMLSSEQTVTTAPSTLDENNHVRITFNGSPGFIRYVIYRLDGSNYYRVGEVKNSIDLQFFDIQESGSSTVPVTGYPSVTDDAPKAFAITDTFEPGELSTSAYTPHTLTIQVPTTYDRSLTTNGNQWFRFGLSALVNSASKRGISIRRVSVSEAYGSWTRSPKDMTALSGPSTSATSAPPPGTPPPSDPPSGGGGGTFCVSPETLIETEKGSIPICHIEKGDWVACGAMSLPVGKVKKGTVQSVMEIKTENNTLLCSASHRLIRNKRDRRGTAARRLKVGDKVLMADFTEKEITSITEIIGQRQVLSLSLPAPHLFITNGFVSHNLKPESVQ